MCIAPVGDWNDNEGRTNLDDTLYDCRGGIYIPYFGTPERFPAGGIEGVQVAIP